MHSPVNVKLVILYVYGKFCTRLYLLHIYNSNKAFMLKHLHHFYLPHI